MVSALAAQENLPGNLKDAGAQAHSPMGSKLVG